MFCGPVHSNHVCSSGPSGVTSHTPSFSTEGSCGHGLTAFETLIYPSEFLIGPVQDPLVLWSCVCVCVCVRMCVYVCVCMCVCAEVSLIQFLYLQYPRPCRDHVLIPNQTRVSGVESPGESLSTDTSLCRDEDSERCLEPDPIKQPTLVSRGCSVPYQRVLCVKHATYYTYTSVLNMRNGSVCCTFFGCPRFLRHVPFGG